MRFQLEPDRKSLRRAGRLAGIMVLSTAFGFPVFFPLIWRWQFAVFKNSEEQAWGVLEAALVGAAVGVLIHGLLCWRERVRGGRV
jgi:hypothetical protein